jgi:hypothetical protein
MSGSTNMQSFSICAWKFLTASHPIGLYVIVKLFELTKFLIDFVFFLFFGGGGEVTVRHVWLLLKFFNPLNICDSHSFSCV